MSSASATESTNTPLPASPNSAKLRDSPRRSAEQRPKDRIDSILGAARARKVALGGNSNTMGGNTDSTKDSNAARQTDREGEQESSADETTGIVARPSRREPVSDYQGTNLRKGRKPSTSSIRRAGRTHVPEEVRDEDELAGTESWWERLLSDYGSIELENKGSVARDHLALERTFLAWLRTSLAFASIGIAITQLFRLNTTSASSPGQDPYKHLRQMGKPLGATFLGISIVMLFVGFHRYFESQHWIIRGKFPASRGSIALVAAITFALMVTSLVVVVVVEPGRFEKRAVEIVVGR